MHNIEVKQRRRKKIANTHKHIDTATAHQKKKVNAFNTFTEMDRKTATKKKNRKKDRKERRRKKMTKDIKRFGYLADVILSWILFDLAIRLNWQPHQPSYHHDRNWLVWQKQAKLSHFLNNFFCIFSTLLYREDTFLYWIRHKKFPTNGWLEDNKIQQKNCTSKKRVENSLTKRRKMSAKYE